MRRIIPLLLLLTLPLLLTAFRKEPPPPPAFDVTSSKEDVEVRSLPDDEGVTFLIFSPTGIGDATFTLTQGNMPQPIQVRLFVKNLENLELTYGDVKIAAIATPEGVVSETLYLAGGEARIDPDSFYWVDIQPLPEEPGARLFGYPTLPPSFLITLPSDFYASGQKTFTLRWVDFYR
jgi:hypothetical protein